MSWHKHRWSKWRDHDRKVVTTYGLSTSREVTYSRQIKECFRCGKKRSRKV